MLIANNNNHSANGNNNNDDNTRTNNHINDYFSNKNTKEIRLLITLMLTITIVI